MQTIPFAEALRLLDSAHQFEIAEEPVTVTAVNVHTDYEDEDVPFFLVVEADNSDDYEFRWCFLAEHNQEVRVSGDIMWLHADPEELDVSSPTLLGLRLLLPQLLEPETPPIVLKAIRHVRAHIPDVDRVVYWNDDTFTFLTSAHTVPSFAGLLIDAGLLEAAAAVVSADLPRAYQLNHES